MTNDTLSREFCEQLTKRGYQPEVVECLVYQDPPQGHVVVRSPFSEEWGSDAEHQINIEYNADHARCTEKRCNTYYPHRMVKVAVETYERIYIHKRLTKAELKARGLGRPQDDTRVYLAGNVPVR